MSDTDTTIHDVQALVCAPDGAQLKSENDALDLIGEAIFRWGWISSAHNDEHVYLWDATKGLPLFIFLVLNLLTFLQGSG